MPHDFVHAEKFSESSIFHRKKLVFFEISLKLFLVTEERMKYWKNIVVPISIMLWLKNIIYKYKIKKKLLFSL